MHYFGSEYYLQGSDFVKTRRKTVHYEDLIGDIARSETVNGIAILGNSVPTAFWTIFHIYSDWGVLQTVRDQVSQITSLSPDGRTKFINISKLRDAPIIFSVLQEALRHRATGTGPRLVMEDISVGDEGYLLKRGSLVIIANKALHFDKEEWGDDVAAFRADRFCKKTPSRAFRGFGGGVNLCPGRGFAMVEVGALIAMLAMRYDIEPVVAGQGWREPGQKMTNMSLQIAPPGAKVVVDFVPRPGAMDFTWEFSL